MSDFDIQRFEDSSHQNGIRYWIAHEFMETLGYESWSSFYQVINRATSSCVALNVPILEAFIPTKITYEGKEVDSFKLTRFACFMITMHADSKKPEVSKAKTVLAGIADALVEQAIQQDALDRLEVREELKLGEAAMSQAAFAAGIQSKEYGIFKDAGYRGLYNMSLKTLIAHKGMDKNKGKTLYDFMGKTELAANLFRVTQTAERIQNTDAKGIDKLKKTARDVGQEVRSVMLRSSGIAPENLPLEENINSVKGRIKSASKEMKKLDAPAKKKRIPKK